MISLKEGVSLRNIHKWQIVFAVIFSCLMIFSTYRLINSFMRVKNASEENLMLQNSVHGLMDASDHLTEMVQRFTESGDRRFMEQYFIEAFATKRREQAITELKRVKNVGPALASLEEAMRYSVKLMDREYYAMRLVIEAKGIREYPSVLKGVTLNSADMALSPEDKMRRATKMVLDGEYYTQKNRIRAEVNNTVQAIVSQAQKEETDALERFQKELNLARDCKPGAEGRNGCTGTFPKGTESGARGGFDDNCIHLLCSMVNVYPGHKPNPACSGSD